MGRFDTSPMFNKFLLGLSRQRHSLPLTVLKLICFLRRINTTLVLFCLSLCWVQLGLKYHELIFKSLTFDMA